MNFLGIYIILKLSFRVSTRGFLDFLLGGIGDGCAKMKVFLHVCHQGAPRTSQKGRIASLPEGISVGPSVYPQIKLKE